MPLNAPFSMDCMLLTTEVLVVCAWSVTSQLYSHPQDKHVVPLPPIPHLSNLSEWSAPVLQSWLLAESTKGQSCVWVCLCVWGGKKEGVIIGHKPRHGNNTPHTLKTAHTQLETWARLSQIGWLPSTPEHRATTVCMYVLMWPCFGSLPIKKQPTKTLEKPLYEKKQWPNVVLPIKLKSLAGKIQNQSLTSESIFFSFHRKEQLSRAAVD